MVATPSDVTVVICTRNRPEMLANALSKVAAATPPEVRVLVVDSASSSLATRDIVQEAGMQYLRTDVKGLSIARNLGYENAGREIVVFTDDDCEPIEGWITRLLSPFADLRVGAVTGLLLDHSRIGEVSDRPAVAYRSVRRGLDAGHGALMAFRTDVLRDLGGFDDVLGAGRYFAGAEDLDMFCRVLAAGRIVVNEPRAIVCHINTRDTVAYRVLLGGYGLGLGAMTNKWLRLAPWTGMQLVGIVYVRAFLRLMRRIRSARERRGQLAMVRGISIGLAATRGFTLSGSRFVDEDRPSPTPIVSDGRSDAEAAR